MDDIDQEEIHDGKYLDDDIVRIWGILTSSSEHISFGNITGELDRLRSINNSLTKQVNEFADTLRWYANENQYNRQWDWQFQIEVAPIESDRGRRARATLEDNGV